MRDSHSVRVLIADDEELTREAIVGQLKCAGCEVVGEAHDGNEAVELALGLHPDVVILDIRMPGRDGLDAAREIMEREPMAIVMLTALHDQEIIRRANEVGVFAYLVKPANINTLKATIDIALVRFDELQAARREATDLKEALATRKLVERAKGILMDRLGLGEADAFRRLQHESNNQRKPLKQIAEVILIAEGIFNTPAE